MIMLHFLIMNRPVLKAMTLERESLNGSVMIAKIDNAMTVFLMLQATKIVKNINHFANSMELMDV